MTTRIGADRRLIEQGQEPERTVGVCLVCNVALFRCAAPLRYKVEGCQWRCAAVPGCTSEHRSVDDPSARLVLPRECCLLSSPPVIAPASSRGDACEIPRCARNDKVGARMTNRVLGITEWTRITGAPRTGQALCPAGTALRREGRVSASAHSSPGARGSRTDDTLHTTNIC